MEYVLALFSENPVKRVARYTEYLQRDDNLGHLSGEGSKRLDDLEAHEAMNRICGTNTVAGFQTIPLAKRGIILKELHEQGVSIRQIARLTGVSIGLVRKEL